MTRSLGTHSVAQHRCVWRREHISGGLTRVGCLAYSPPSRRSDRATSGSRDCCRSGPPRWRCCMPPSRPPALAGLCRPKPGWRPGPQARVTQDPAAPSVRPWGAVPRVLEQVQVPLRPAEPCVVPVHQGPAKARAQPPGHRPWQASPRLRDGQDQGRAAPATPPCEPYALRRSYQPAP